MEAEGQEIEDVLEYRGSETSLGCVRSCLVGNGKGTETANSPDDPQSISAGRSATHSHWEVCSVEHGSPWHLDYIYLFKIGKE